MTTDGLSGSTISYNHLNLPAKITQNGIDLAKYSYLADGSKSKAENGSAVGLVYRGSLIYRKAANGTLTLEGATLPEGRLTVNGVRWHVKDHLGSVRAVVDGATGNLLAVTDYEAYGEESANSAGSSYLSPAPAGETFRDRFTGKEDQGPDFGTAYTDFGARQYSPALRRWLVPDPLSEKYYGVSPYAYCAGDPVNMVDEDGNKPRVFIQRKGVGHAFITIGEGRNTRVFSYGRYGAVSGPSGSSITSGRFSPRGEGVLFMGEGDAAANYLKKVVKEGGVVMFVLNIDNEDAIYEYYSKLFNDGSIPFVNRDKESYLNPNYAVVDEYKLLSNNCVTTSIHGLEASGWPIQCNTVIPSFFSGYLYKEAGLSKEIQYYDEEEARNFLIWLVSLLQPQNN